MNLRQSIIESIDAHAYLARVYYRWAEHVHLVPVARAREVARDHDTLATNLAIDAGLATAVPIQNPKSKIQNHREVA